MKTLSRHACFILIGLAACGTSVRAGSLFTTIDVGGAGFTQAAGINNNGQIVGAYKDAEGFDRGFLLSNNTVTSISDSARLNTATDGINSQGQYVGYAWDSQAGQFDSYVATKNSFTLFNVPGATVTLALGINSAGTIVGVNSVQSTYQGFLLSNGSFTPINAPFAGVTRTNALGINDNGAIVGSYTVGINANHGFLLSQGTYYSIDVPGATNTQVYGINNFGAMVGYYYDASGKYHGFLDTGGNIQTIDFPGAVSTSANGINDLGQIVGYFVDEKGIAHGFLDSPLLVSEPTSVSNIAVAMLLLPIVVYVRRLQYL